MRTLAFLFVTILLCSAGCTGALISHMSFRSGPAIGTTQGQVSQEPLQLTKPEVLARFGAPEDVIPQAGGDIFVYRMRQADLEVLNLNPAFVLGLGFTVWAQFHGLQAADVLYIHFGQDGRVRDISSAWRL